MSSFMSVCLSRFWKSIEVDHVVLACSKQNTDNFVGDELVDVEQVAEADHNAIAKLGTVAVLLDHLTELEHLSCDVLG
jgi:hypothetical protein